MSFFSLSSPDVDSVNERLLVVFFEGTANALRPISTQIGLFYDACNAKDVTPTDSISPAKKIASIPSSSEPLKIAFDGCGVTNGILGTLFAAGLDKQCGLVVETVEQILKQKNTHVRVVAVGLSRGGVACLKLALALSKFGNKDQSNKKHVTMSMLLFDPVPGNAVGTGFPYTAASSFDLTACTHIQRVLAIYPYEPLPDLAMHAPVLVKYPDGCSVEEDVTLGCHQGALFGTGPASAPHIIASNLSFRRIYDYLQSELVPLSFSAGVFEPSAKYCVKIYRNALRENKPSKRITIDKVHSRNIIRRDRTVACKWLNKHHQHLEETLQKPKDNVEFACDTKYQLDFDDRTRPHAFSTAISNINMMCCGTHDYGK